MEEETNHSAVSSKFESEPQKWKKENSIDFELRIMK